MVGPALTQSRLKEVIDYSPDTGEFTWKISPANNTKAGSIAGGIDDQGYRRIRVDGRRYKAHRLAWLYVFGAWPEHEIDHINLDRSDNRISNLREATMAENMRNRSGWGKTGLKGAYVARVGFSAVVQVDGMPRYLGRFPTAEAAHAAYVSAANDLHGEFARAS